MRLEIAAPSMANLMSGIEGDLAAASTGAMRESTSVTKQELRDQVTSAGLGNRLANTWRGESYPKSRNSMNPAGYIYSTAPDIIDSFNRGASIRPTGGRKYLWIPTKNVPLARARVGRPSPSGARGLKGGAITPEECENRFNTDFVIRRGRAGRLLAFMDLIAASRGGAFRPNTVGRRRQGRSARPVLMFVLVPATRLPKLLDVEVVAERWAVRFETGFTERLNRR